MDEEISEEDEEKIVDEVMKGFGIDLAGKNKLSGEEISAIEEKNKATEIKIGEEIKKASGKTKTELISEVVNLRLTVELYKNAIKDDFDP